VESGFSQAGPADDPETGTSPFSNAGGNGGATSPAAGDYESVYETANRILPVLSGINTVTVVVHGFQFSDPNSGDALWSIADAIASRTDGWLLDYDVQSDTGQGVFDVRADPGGPTPVTSSRFYGNAAPSHLVLLFDWGAESFQLTAGWGEAAGDGLFSLMVSLGFVEPGTGQALPHRSETATGPPILHFIAHSMGAAVIGETVERLDTFGVPVDQMTFLDPHDFDQDLEFDDGQRLFDLGAPNGYGATVWNNVRFADAYYQTSSRTLLPEDDIPDGRPVPGAYNRWLSPEDLGEQAFQGADSDHSRVWDYFYRNTITGPNATEGYAFSHLGAHAGDRPAPVFNSDPEHPQDHQFSSPSLVNQETGQPNATGLAALGLSPAEVTLGRWEPQFNPLVLTNGNFEAASTALLPGNAGGSVEPGWSYHGGRGDGRFFRPALGTLSGATVYLELGVYGGGTTTSRTHNQFYLSNAPGAEAAYLVFDLQTFNTHATNSTALASLGNDRLRVQLTGLDGGVINLTGADGISVTVPDLAFRPIVLPIPATWRGQVVTLTFRIDGGADGVAATVGIDQVRLATQSQVESDPALKSSGLYQDLAARLGQVNFWSWLDRLLDDQVLGGKLPLLGDVLNFLRSDAAGAFANKIQGLSEKVAQVFREGLDPNDVVIEERLQAGLSALGLAEAQVTRRAEDNVEFGFQFDRTFTFVLPIRSTWPNLALELDGLIELNVRLAMDLTLGWEKRQGQDVYYVQTSQPDEIHLEFSIDTPGNLGAQLGLGNAVLGAEGVTVSANSRAHLEAAYNIDLRSDDPLGPGWDGRLEIEEIFSPREVLGSGTIYFGFGQPEPMNGAADTPQDPVYGHDYLREAQDLAALIKMAYDARVPTHTGFLEVSLYGFADTIGGTNANLKLSRQRAEAIERILAAAGVPEPILFKIYLGEHPDYLTVSNAGDTPTPANITAQAPNRRVEVYFYDPLQESPSLGNIVTVSGGGAASLDLELSSPLVNNGQALVTLSVAWPDLNHPDSVVYDFSADGANQAAVAAFRGLAATGFEKFRNLAESGLGRLSDWFQSVSGLGDLSHQLSLAERPLGDLIETGSIVQQILGPAGDYLAQEPHPTISGFIAKLNEGLTGFGNSIAASFVGQDLELEVDFSAGGAPQTLSLLQSDVAVLTTDRTAPANGVLSGDANFTLRVDGGDLFPVQVQADPDNQSVADLVDDVQDALEEAGLGGVVLAGETGGILFLRGINSPQGGNRSLQIFADTGSPALTALGFSNGQTARNSGLSSSVENQAFEVPGLQASFRAQFALGFHLDPSVDGLEAVYVRLDPAQGDGIEFRLD
jgi:OmpA family